MARPRLHTNELRETLIDRAAEIIVEAGPGRLSLRRLAADAGTSTSAVYSLFGSKPALLDAIQVRATRAFGDHQNAVPVTEDPLEDIYQLGIAYLDWASENPTWYTAVFSHGRSEEPPSAEYLAEAERAITPLHTAVARASAAELLRPASTGVIATSMWAYVHGIAALDVGRSVPSLDLEAFRREAADAALRGWRIATPEGA